MQLVSAFIFALSANIDCLAIGLTYGMREINISNRNNLLIAAISSIGTFISMSIGTYIIKLFSIQWMNFVGCIILFVTGVYLIYQYIQERMDKKKQKNLQDYDIDHSGTINGNEVVALSLGLAANNAGVGIGASIAGIPILLSCVLTFVLSLWFIRISTSVGKSISSKWSGEYATLISGILMMLLGIYELFI